LENHNKPCFDTIVRPHFALDADRPHWAFLARADPS